MHFLKPSGKWPVTQPASYSVRIWRSFLGAGGKEARAWRWPLIPSSAEFKNAWNYASVSQNVFVLEMDERLLLHVLWQTHDTVRYALKIQCVLKLAWRKKQN